MEASVRDLHPAVYTQLNRPSSSIASGPGPATSALAVPTFPPSEYFDGGAGGESFGNESFHNHGSLHSDSFGRPRRDYMEQSGFGTRQRHGLQNFPQQQSGQQPQPGTNSWDCIEQQKLLYNGMHGVNESNPGTTPQLNPNVYGGDARLNHSGPEAGRTELGGISLQYTEQARSSSVMRGQPWMQPFSAPGPSSHLQNKFSHAVSVGSVPFGRPTPNNGGSAMDTQFQNQRSRIFAQNLPGVAMSDMSYGPRSTWKGPGQGAVGQQLRSAQKHNDSHFLQQQALQSQHKLQEASQQLEQYSRQQEAHLQLSGTSYSALLHGPDTPPSHPEEVGGLPVGELENESTANFPSANFTGAGWPLNGLSYYHGFPGMVLGQDANSALQLPSKGFQVDHSLYLGNTRDGGVLTAPSYPEKQNVLPEHLDCGPKVPLDLQAGKSISHSHHPANAQMQSAYTNYYGPTTIPSKDPTGNEQIYPGQPLGQNPQQYSNEYVERNQMASSFHNINALPKTQHNSGDLQASHQRSWASNEERRDPPMHYLMASRGLAQNTMNFEDNNLRNSPQQSLANNDMTGKGQGFQRVSYQSGSSLLENVEAFKQQQNWTAQTQIKRTADLNAEPFTSHSVLQAPQTRPDLGNNPHNLRETKRKVWLSNSSQQIGDSTHPVDPSSNRQMGYDHAQHVQPATSSGPREASAAWMGNAFHPNQRSIDVLHEMRARREPVWKENEKVAKASHVLTPSSEMHGNSQGSWKSHTPSNQSPAGTDTMGHSSDKDGHGSICNHDFQQGGGDAEVSYRRKPAPRMQNMDSTSKPAYARSFMGGTVADQPLLSQNRQVHLANQHMINRAACLSGEAADQPFLSQNRQVYLGRQLVANRATGLDEQAGKLDTMDMPNHEKNSELEGPCIKKQRKHPEQIHTSASSISLAHLRPHNQGPMSPQNIKLGLGPPSNAPQSVQHSSKDVWNTLSHVQGQDCEPSTSSASRMHNSVPAHFSNCGAQVSCDHIAAQSPAASCNAPFLESNLSVAPTLHVAPLDSFGGGGPIQKELKNGGSFSSSPVHILDSMTSFGYAQGKASSAFVGHSPVPGDYLKQPNRDGGAREAMPGQNAYQKHQMYDSNSRQALQDQVATMRHFGDKAQGAGPLGSLNHMKTSMSFPGIVESFPISRGDALPPLQKAQMSMRKPMDRMDERLTLVPRSNMAYERTNQVEPLDNERFTELEPRRLAPPNLHANLQEQNASPSYMFNGPMPSHPQVGGESDDHSKFQQGVPFFYSKAPVSQSSPQLRGSRYAPSFFAQDHRVRQPMEMNMENTAVNQSSQSLKTSDALVVESAAEGANQIVEQEKRFAQSMIPSNSKGFAERAMSQQTGVAYIATEPKQPPISEASLENYGSPSDQALANHRHAPSSFPLAQKQSLIENAGNFTAIPCCDRDSLIGPRAVSTIASYPGASSHEQMSLHPAAHHNTGRDLPVCQQVTGSNLTELQPYAGQVHGVSTVGEHSLVRDGESRILGRDSNSIPGQSSQQPLSPPKRPFHSPVAVHPKKRKKPVPLLIPWHIAASQPTGHLPSCSDVELMWANATNRLPEKDDGETHSEGMSTVSQAKRRLRLTSHLMQQLIPPLSSTFLHGNTPVDYECATYHVAKITLEEACRMVSGAEKEVEPATNSLDNKNTPSSPVRQGTWGSIKKVATVERFGDNIKRLDGDLARLDCSMSASELKRETQELENLSIVNRLAKHHGTGFPLDPSSEVFIENIPGLGPGVRRPPPQKYVTAVPIPKTLPESVRCLSL